MKKKVELWGIVLITLLSASSEVCFSQIFPGLTGNALTDAIRAEYTPASLLNDTQVKDTLYARVFAQEDSVRCVYSGLARFLPAGEDPSQWLFGSGLEPGSVNLEHTWPQSKGAGEGNAGNMNMYHLFPARTAINSDRADFPFREINDEQTSKWYYREFELNLIPGVHLEYYSELGLGLFEPRENMKGDIARGMFYFWTIYRDDAMAADPGYFNLLVDDLCLWHHQDPADSDEMRRNDIISSYQDGKKNPFILDCSLAMRAYCDELPACEIVSAGFVQPGEAKLIFEFPSGQILIEDQEEREWQIMIIDQLGRMRINWEMRSNVLSGSPDLPPGVYFALAIQSDRILTAKLVMQ